MLLSLLTFLAALGSGLMSGLLFAFSNFVMQALSRLPDASGVGAMQAINETILNPFFFLIFFGTGVVSGILLILSVAHVSAVNAACAVVGSALYLVGVLGVTMLRNVPMNKRLADADTGDTENLAYWRVYVEEWMWWNHVRSFAAVGAMGAFVLALA